MAKYVQYLNVGFGIINNTKEVKEWNVDVAIEEALMIEDEERDIHIIGFLFFEKDYETNQILSQSSIYYLRGNIVEIPSADAQIVSYFERKQQTVPIVPVVKIQTPFFVIYPYHEGDQIVDLVFAKEKIEFRKKQVRIAKLREELENYKQKLVQELHNIADALEQDEFLLVPLVSGGSNGIQHLDVMGDCGNFQKHIEFLQERIEELTKLQLPEKNVRNCNHIQNRE